MFTIPSQNITNTSYNLEVKGVLILPIRTFKFEIENRIVDYFECVIYFIPVYRNICVYIYTLIIYTCIDTYIRVLIYIHVITINILHNYREII